MSIPSWDVNPDRARTSAMHALIDTVRQRGLADVHTYADLYAWSIREPQTWWSLLMEIVPVQFHGQHMPAYTDTAGVTPLARHWFPHVRFNVADALCGDGESTDCAIIAWNEQRQQRSLSRRELGQHVHHLAGHLARLGVTSQSRTFAYTPNIPEAVVAMLASAYLGATWASCGTDYQADGVLARAKRIQPQVVFVATRYQWRGRTIDTTALITQLLHEIPSIRVVVIIDPLQEYRPLSFTVLTSCTIISYAEMTQHAPSLIAPHQLFAFDHPLYHLFSSGTTGTPKGIVHGAGGTVLEHLKEQLFHCDIRPGERVFFHTSTSWMMWNWLVSALAIPATIVLYDGDPFADNGTILWQLTAHVGINHFGSSAAYFQLLQDQQHTPHTYADVSSLQSIMSTGSTLHAPQFHYLRSAVAPVPIASISGGTDIVGCFALGNPLIATQAGRITCKSLGVDIVALDSENHPIQEHIGELVCRNPIPSMPVAFLDDPDGSAYRDAYFARIPGMWHHGDMVCEYADGSLEFLGRSDATLNPGGVRIATAELYAALKQLAPINDALAVAYTPPGGTLERIMLFVVLEPEHVLDDTLAQHIRQHLRQYNVYYVPWRIVQAPDVPRTHNQKLAELPIKRLLQAHTPVNAAVLRNPECLEWYTHFAHHHLPLMIATDLPST